jgi:DNA-binding CsgD family transcriptional regulator
MASSERGVSQLLAELRRLVRSRRRPSRTSDAVALVGKLLAAASYAGAEEKAGGFVVRLRAADGHSDCLMTCHIRDANDDSLLTASERHVAEQLCEGRTLAQIARLRGVTINTIKSQVRQIFRKLDVNSRVALVRRLCP